MLNESRLWTQCLTERNVLALSNATFKSLFRLNVSEKAKIVQVFSNFLSLEFSRITFDNNSIH